MVFGLLEEEKVEEMKFPKFVLGKGGKEKMAFKWEECKTWALELQKKHEPKMTELKMYLNSSGNVDRAAVGMTTPTGEYHEYPLFNPEDVREGVGEEKLEASETIMKEAKKKKESEGVKQAKRKEIQAEIKKLKAADIPDEYKAPGLKDLERKLAEVDL